LVASAEAWLAALPEATGWLLAVGLAHVAGLGVVWRAALSGVPLVVLARPDPVAILAALGAAPHPSHVSLVPTVLTRLLDLGGDDRPPPTLRTVPVGGGVIPPGLIRRAISAGWPVVPTYGLSEAGSGVTASATDDAAIHPDTAGRPLPGVELRIARPDAEGIGEIQVTGPALFSGYLGDPLATAAAWSDDGWLRTGDLGRIDADGRLVVADRRSDRIVRGGENISPTEVEAVLLDHPAIADAVVVARVDQAYGQVPVAAILLRHGHADPGDEALEALCRQRLARFKVPVAFIRLDAIPRTATGKPRRAELRATLDPTQRIEQESPA
jgi:O-succinylbenzoic acid--CoA ligase